MCVTICSDVDLDRFGFLENIKDIPNDKLGERFMALKEPPK